MNRNALIWRASLRAFPRRFRAVRGDELLATMEEAASFGRQPGLRDAVDIARAGWSERLRSRPPVHVRMGYRMIDRRLPQQWHPWMLDDVAGRVAGRRHFTVVAFIVGVQFAVGSMTVMPTAFVAVGVLILAGLVDLVGRGFINRRLRRKILDRHGYELLGDGSIVRRTLADPVPLRWVPIPPPTHRRVGPILTTWGVALTASLPIGFLAHFRPDVLPRSISIGSNLSLGRDPLDHQWGMGVATMSIAAAVAALAIGHVQRRGQRSIVALATSEAPGQVASGAVPAIGGAIVIVAIAFGGLLRILPMLLPDLVYAAAGLGPAMILLAAKIRRFERASGMTCWAASSGQRIAAASRV